MPRKLRQLKRSQLMRLLLRRMVRPKKKELPRKKELQLKKVVMQPSQLKKRDLKLISLLLRNQKLRLRK
jgi:hypothetical protein